MALYSKTIIININMCFGQALQVPSHCTYEVKDAYPGSRIDKTFFFNLGCSMLILSPSILITYLSQYYLCIIYFVLPSNNPIYSQISLQEHSTHAKLLLFSYV